MQKKRKERKKKKRKTKPNGKKQFVSFRNKKNANLSAAKEKSIICSSF